MNAQKASSTIYKDINEFHSNGLKDIQVEVNDKDITKVHALIHGPTGTPYAFGFFYFFVEFPTNYPLYPPKVSLMTTANRTVRLNPNFYKCGKVCLSILGTWSGSDWTPIHTLTTVLLSIQSLMNENPYYNEPGFEKQKTSKDKNIEKKVKDYNECILYETIRVAVLDMLVGNSCDSRNLPQVLKNAMIESFKKNYQYFEDIVKSRLELTNTSMIDAFDKREIKFDYKNLLKRLQTLKNKLIDSQE